MDPDWYDDPTGLPFQRYWDGVSWTASTRPMQSHPTQPLQPAQAWSGPNMTAPLPYVPPVPPAPPQKWYRRKGVLIPVAVVAFLIVIGAIGAAMDPAKKDNTADPAGRTRSQPAALPPETPRTSAAPTASTRPRVPAPKPASSSLRPRKTHASDHIGSFAMPNEVGQVLQDAQDDIQRVSRDPFFFSHSHDLIDDRLQILDRDWQVCTQHVPPGEAVTAEDEIDFGVVKLDESCP